MREGGDIAIEGLSFCRTRVDVPLYQMDAAATPFADESFDIVGVFDMIEHLQDDQSSLNEIFRICKKNGEIVLTVPADKSLWSYFDEACGHKRRYRRDEIMKKLLIAGFEVDRASYFMTFLFPLLWILRKVCGNNARTRLFCRLPEVRTIPGFNQIFLLLSRIESRLLMKFDLPFGSSLVCVATRRR